MSKSIKKSVNKKKMTKKQEKQWNEKFMVSAKEFVKDPEKHAPNAEKYNYTKTELESINKSPALLKAKIKSLLKKGRVQIETKEELENFRKGALVSYMTNDGLYRSGGFLKKLFDDYFVLQGGTSGNPISFSVQFKNTKYMWVGDPRKTLDDEVSLNTKKDETNFPVKIGDRIVYYAKHRYDRDRFKQTNKYKRMKEWYEKWGKKPEHKDEFDDLIKEKFKKPRKLTIEDDDE